METRKNPQFPPLAGKNNLIVIKLGYSPNWRRGCMVWLLEGYGHMSADTSIHLSQENSPMASGEEKTQMLLLGTLQSPGQPSPCLQQTIIEPMSSGVQRLRNPELDENKCSPKTYKKGGGEAGTKRQQSKDRQHEDPLGRSQLKKKIRTISYILLESFRLPHGSEAPFILNTSGSWNNYVSESLGVPIFTQ